MSQKALDNIILKRFFKEELKPYLKTAFIAVIFMVVAAITTTLSAWIIKFVIDDIFIDKKAAMVLPVAFGIVLIYVTKGVATYIYSAILAQISANLSANMRGKMLSSLLAREMVFFDKHDTSDLINRIANVTKSAGNLVRLAITAAMRDFL